MTNPKKNIVTKLKNAASDWIAPAIPADIPHGDMPGDQVRIGDDHIKKANLIFPRLCDLLSDACAANPFGKTVITVCGGSGVGKSEIASLLAFYLRQAGIGAYTLSGDNYPRRIPMYNDAERLRIFRTAGLRGLLDAGLYSSERSAALNKLWAADADTDPALTVVYPWLTTYQLEGRAALKRYLGTDAEHDFAELSDIISHFKNGIDNMWLKRMGRTPDALWYDNIDFSGVNVLIIEWTHGNSDHYSGVDIPVLLNSTPQETKEHRRLRNRDGKTDSAFTTMILEIEQGMLQAQAHKAKLIVAKSGRFLSYEEYCSSMKQL